MTPTINLNNVMVFDIETIPLYPSFEEMPEHLQEMWVKKLQRINSKPNLTIEEASAKYKETSFYPEYARIICLSIAYIKRGEWRIGSFCDEDERVLLESFIKVNSTLESLALESRNLLHWSGHNIKRFDIPFLCRRLQSHNLPIPHTAPTYTTKPWEVKCYDTSDFWKYGDGVPASLDEICFCLGIESSKIGEIDGSKVFETFKLGNLKAISEYCERDVVATVRVLERLSNNQPLNFYEKEPFK